MSRRKPNAVHMLSGSFRRDRHEPRPSALPPEMPSKPAALSPAAGRIWNILAPQLAEARFLTRLDGDMLATLCELQAEFVENPREMATPRIALLRQLHNDFGLSPLHRDRINVVPEPERNKFADLDDLSTY